MNSFDPINPAEVDQFDADHDGYPDALAAADTPEAMRFAAGNAARDFPQSLWIEPKDWADKARDNDRYKTWGINYLDRFTHQGNSHECTCHALRAVAEACRNRQRGIIYAEGPVRDRRYAESASGSVWLSPMSIYAEANPSQWGGAGCQQVLEIAVRRGFLPEKTQPREYNFRHAINGTAGGTNAINQSDGEWVPVRNFPAGWQKTAEWFKPLEVIFPDSWEQAVCLLLHGYVLEYGRSGHAVPPAFWNVAEQKAGYVDSYNRILYDSLGTFRSASNGCFTIATMTAPDDWLHPVSDQESI